MSIQFSEYRWQSRQVGLNDRMVKTQVRINDDSLREAMFDTAKRYIEGNVTPLRIVDAGTHVSRKLKTRKVIRELTEDGQAQRARYEEIPVTMEHIGGIALHTADDFDGSTHDADGNKIEPFLCVAFHECSQAFVPFLLRRGVAPAPNPASPEPLGGGVSE